MGTSLSFNSGKSSRVVFLIANASSLILSSALTHNLIFAKWISASIVIPIIKSAWVEIGRTYLACSFALSLDLVLLNSDPKNPVCKIIDYNKYRYEKQKQIKEAKKRQREQNLEVKEYRLSVTIDVGDFETKLRNAKAYLEKGHKIKVAVRFKGRQIDRPELGKEVMLRFAEELSDVSIIESQPKLEGRTMIMLLAPKK